eukprot:3787957-Rhodomonas_salina.1
MEYIAFNSLPAEEISFVAVGASTAAFCLNSVLTFSIPISVKGLWSLFTTLIASSGNLKTKQRSRMSTQPRPPMTQKNGAAGNVMIPNVTVRFHRPKRVRCNKQRGN